ncbi:DUF4055 domain-containing protein [Chromobacterium subtsugae]|uniref:DUF4055 domain-containing protein n=1 Tax=Chromobacterium subtsugae TaxID=251747 RepID=UPI0007F8D677|nr:DUF4055 domain-containing protein [Chromobacterium subtsugae]OBU85483.1 hypothetical protein MY55_16015 [Chromobacterium subtsugae]
MPINSTHPDYDANIDKWQRCRDAYDGEDAVKAAGTKYLPKLGGQTGEEYEAYKLRALYYEAMGRSVDGFVGAIARKPTVIELPDGLAAVGQDATADGVNLQEFIKSVCSENLLAGRLGILVDHDGARAYLRIYRAENIINWGANWLVLTESVCIADPADQYKQKEVVQCRELMLDGSTYRARIWRQKADATGRGEWEVAEESTPAKRGAALNSIPFFWLSPQGGTQAISKPPLLGLANVALSHYRSSADLEHGRHFTGLPTLWVSGLEDTDQPIMIGSATLLKVPNPQGRVEYAEFHGTGLGSLERALESKEHMMAVLGAAVFADQRRGVEAAETARIRTSGETSLLMGTVTATEGVIIAALQCAADWMGVSGDIKVTINRDFVDTQLGPQQLQGLVQAYQAGSMSLDTFIFNMQQAEMLPPDRTIDDEKELIRAAGAIPPMVMPNDRQPQG